MELKNKVALVTGASKGIGKATAITLSKEGAKVIISYKSDSKSAENVINECNKHSKDNFSIQADITKDNEVQEMFTKISNNFQSLDILVNNAGIYEGSDNPNDLKIFEKIFQSNLLGQIRVTEQFLKLCKVGRIINVSSIHGKLGHGNPSGIAYSALKASFNSYTKNLAKALAPKILVNGIAPGRTLTLQWGNLSDKEEKELGEGQLINRFITSEEIASGIVFLIKNDAVCGEILAVDGGMSLKTLG